MLSMIMYCCLFVIDVHEYLIIPVANYEQHNSPDNIINRVI